MKIVDMPDMDPPPIEAIVPSAGMNPDDRVTAYYADGIIGRTDVIVSKDGPRITDEWWESGGRGTFSDPDEPA